MKDYLGIYIHSPFCTSKCGYCSFYSFPGTAHEKESYISLLNLDIQSQIASHSENYEYSTIYFGGGTPSNFSSFHVSNILKNTKEELEKKSINIREITIEANPADYELNDYLTLRQAGVTRLSIGIQSPIDAELNLMGRRHNAKEALIAVEYAGKVGFSTVSADFIYGLPNQDFKKWEGTLSRLINMGLNHISLYELSLEEGTPFYEQEIVKNDESRIIAFLEEMIEFLSKKGFERYEISNYSKGIENQSIHNLNYWHQRDYLGFGPSAVSTIGNRRVTMNASLKNYLDGNLTKEIEELSKEQIAFEQIMLGMRCKYGIPLKNIKDYHQNYLTNEEREVAERSLKNFIALGHCQEVSGILSLTDKGFLLYNEIISTII